MGKRDALKQLSKALPASDEVEKIMEDLRKKDDIHVAIMAVAIVEAKLEHLIVSKLHKKDKQLLNRVFDNRGPLSDFNSKILIAEALGIITSPLAEEMHTMRAIRNAFAHSKQPISFDDGPVAREVQSLTMLKAMSKVEIKMPGVVNIQASLTNKAAFLLITKISLTMLDEFIKTPGLADNVLGAALTWKS